MIKSKVEVKEKDVRDTTVPWVASLLIFNSVSSGKQGNLKHDACFTELGISERVTNSAAETLLAP